MEVEKDLQEAALHGDVAAARAALDNGAKCICDYKASRLLGWLRPHAAHVKPCDGGRAARHSHVSPCCVFSFIL